MGTEAEVEKIREADGKATEKYPDKVFYLARVGYRAAFVRR